MTALGRTGLSTSLPPGKASGGYAKASFLAWLRLGSRVAVGLLMILIPFFRETTREMVTAANVARAVMMTSEPELVLWIGLNVFEKKFIRCAILMQRKQGR